MPRTDRPRRGYRGVTVAENAPEAEASFALGLYVLADQSELAANDKLRPRTRGECVNGPRPCPWVSCRHHLYLEVMEGGSIRLNVPTLEVHEMASSCSLDVADFGPQGLAEIGEMMSLTHERVRQLEVRSLINLQSAAGASDIDRTSIGDFAHAHGAIEPDQNTTGAHPTHWTELRRKGVTL